jgi:hypothetical protein
MLEDDDYSLRAHAAGLRVICLEDTLVHHFGESSFGRLVSSGRYNELLEANKQRFEEKWGRPWEPYAKRAKPGYDRMGQRILAMVEQKLPAGANVLVVSRGDERLLQLPGHTARHFPEGEGGVWAGHNPADSAEAVAALERMRGSGAQFLLMPDTTLWWLDHYDGFRAHLESRYSEVAREDETAVIFALNGHAQ